MTTRIVRVSSAGEALSWTSGSPLGVVGSVAAHLNVTRPVATTGSSTGVRE